MTKKQVPLNPYIAGSALDGPAGFFGREDILRLVWWVSDQVLARQAVDWDAWLDAKRYGLLLTHQEMETLQAWAFKIPKSAISTVTRVMGLLLKELLVPGS